MRKIIATLAAAGCLAPLAVRAADGAKDLYPAAISILLTAEDACPGLKADKVRLVGLRIAAHYREAEEAWVEQTIRERTAEVHSSIRKTGLAAWCAGVMEAYGPNGTVTPGMISR